MASPLYWQSNQSCKYSRNSDSFRDLKKVEQIAEEIDDRKGIELDPFLQNLLFFTDIENNEIRTNDERREIWNWNQMNLKIRALVGFRTYWRARKFEAHWLVIRREFDPFPGHKYRVEVTLRHYFVFHSLRITDNRVLNRSKMGASRQPSPSRSPNR